MFKNHLTAGDAKLAGRAVDLTLGNLNSNEFGFHSPHFLLQN